MSEKSPPRGGTLGPLVVTAEAKVHSRPPVNHEIYNMIGRVASEWAHLEHILDWLIWRLAGVSGPIGHCVTGQLLGHGPRFYAIIALLKHYNYPEDLIFGAIGLMNKTETLANKRNRIVHDAWYVEYDSTDSVLKEPQQFKGVARNELRNSKSKPVYGIQTTESRDDIEKTIADIRARCDEIVKFRTAILNARTT